MPDWQQFGVNVRCNSRVVDQGISLSGRKKSVRRDPVPAPATEACSVPQIVGAGRAQTNCAWALRAPSVPTSNPGRPE